ncbi:MAG: PAS domain S-box protein [Candidatus Omnitrophica bacterium]|nr:PAS domain S-box protein [Candidatus Omnitrophota bacterium]
MKRLIKNYIRKNLDSSYVRYIPVIIIIIIGSILSLTGFKVFQVWENQRIEESFYKQASRYALLLRNQIQLNLDYLDSIKALYMASDYVERDGFSQFVQPILNRNKNILALEWIPAISEEKRFSFEESVKIEGFTDFKIWERNNAGHKTSAGIRKIYYPITYVEPYEENESALGFDLSSNKDTRRDMLQAIDSRNVVVSPRIKIIPEEGDEFGVIVLKPVYKKGSAIDSVEERRKNHIGFILGFFHIRDMLTAPGGYSSSFGTELFLFDESAPEGEQFLYALRQAKENEEEKLFVELRMKKDIGKGLYMLQTFDVGNRKWTLLAIPTKKFGSYLRTGQPWFIFMVGMLIVSLIVNYINSNIGRTVQIEQLVRKRTEELSKTNTKLQIEIFERRLAEKAVQESEEKFRSMSATAQDAIIMFDEEGKVSYWNKAAQRIFGYTEEEIQGQKFYEYISPKRLQEKYKKLYNQFKSSAEGVGESGGILELQALRKGGKEFPIEISVASIRIKSVWNTIAIARDISERKKTQERLNLQGRALESAANIILITDVNGNIQWGNPAFSEVTGYPLQEAVGQNPRFLKSGRHAKGFYKKLWEMILAGKVWSGELTNRRKDGSYYYEDLVITPVSDERGEIISFIGIGQDVTVRKQAEEQLVRQKEDLEKINFELDSFVYTVSHDLRAPLRGISSFASFLEEDYKEKIDEEGMDYLLEIRKGAQRLSKLIEDLLALSRIAKIRNPYEDIPVKQIIEQVISRIQHDIDETHAQIVIQNELPVICCDRVKMAELFVNFINNAIKFSSKVEGQNPRVEIGYADRQDHHEFFVKDNGIGIASEYHDKIFGVFKRLHLDSDFEGTGVGLSIVQRIVEEHKGKVWIDSQLGKGATFYFTIGKHLKEKKKLGEILIEDGLISPNELRQILNKQQENK